MTYKKVWLIIGAGRGMGMDFAVWVWALLMVLVGLPGPLILGALAVFGALLAQRPSFVQGLRASRPIAAGVTLTTAMTSLALRSVRWTAQA
jgi:hypothetical protein